MYVCWFRQDLRLKDNVALSAAAKAGTVLPIYILDEESDGERTLGGASRCWLHHSLQSLNHSLDGKLRVYQGRADEILQKLCEEFAIKGVFWNRCYEPSRRERDSKIEDNLKACGITVASFNGSLLWEPWTIQKADGTPYRVFTPYYRKGCLAKEDAIRDVLPLPPTLTLADGSFAETRLAELRLLTGKAWEAELLEHWQVGEEAAQEALAQFCNSEAVEHYHGGRDLPAQPYVSRLSPHIHWGEVSVHQVWNAVNRIASEATTKDIAEHVDRFKSQLGWREFSYSLLYHFPDLPTKNFQPKFNDFPWRKDDALLKRWQQGQTGYPIVDAGMRELWQTGYMHNRVRMIVGSFLVKNLLLDWRCGEAWFWDCLVDADLANNSASWQWVAGCGADAAPYFRIFNPVTQGEKFDTQGTYTKRYVPELSALPNKYLFHPWDAPDEVLADAGVKLGKNYPKPMVALHSSRDRALRAFRELKRLVSD